jgi:hypothetical protein
MVGPIIAAVAALLMTAFSQWVFDPVVEFFAAHPRAELVIPRQRTRWKRALLRVFMPILLAPFIPWVAYRARRMVRLAWPTVPIGASALLNLTRVTLLDLTLMPKAQEFPLACTEISQDAYEAFVPWLVVLLEEGARVPGSPLGADDPPSG